MASINKLKKLKNSGLDYAGLKNKRKGIKTLHFYTASQRKQDKKINIENID
jgi:hypothetical protein